MDNVIKIVPLSDSETIAVLKSPKFNGLKPVKCEDCGSSAEFVRQIFSIDGVKKDKYCDNETQSIISTHIRRTHGIDSVFFKSCNNKFYTDSACCSRCKSTRIIFDIELTDDFMRQVSKLTGKSIEEVRRGIETTSESLESRDTKKF